MSALISSIYKCLDQEKYEEVIKLCEGREAKKIPHAQALLSYALGEVGRGAEAAAIARELLQSQNPEEKVLNTLCFTFKVMHILICTYMSHNLSLILLFLAGHLGL